MVTFQIFHPDVPPPDGKNVGWCDTVYELPSKMTKYATKHPELDFHKIKAFAWDGVTHDVKATPPNWEVSVGARGAVHWKRY